MRASNIPSASVQGSGSARTREIQTLFRILEDSTQDKSHRYKSKSEVLDAIKVHTRSIKDNADPLCTRNAIQNISRAAFDDGASSQTCQAGMKCLVNIFTLDAPARQLFLDLDYAPKVTERSKIDDREEEFLGTRILFLLTYGTKHDFDPLFRDHGLADSINANLVRHAADPALPSSLALTETLKLLFNLTHFYPNHLPSFAPSLAPVLNLLLTLPLATPPLQPPTTHLLHALLNLPFPPSTPSPLFPDPDPTPVAGHLISILSSTLLPLPPNPSPTDEALEPTLPPLISVLRKLHASEPPPAVHDLLCATLLPSAADRLQPLGQSSSLASALLRLSIAPGAPNLKDGISNLLYELSDSDPTTFVRNVGYGFASGFLMSRGLAVPQMGVGVGGDACGGGGGGGRGQMDPGERVTSVDGVEVNPITGQRRDMEPEGDEVEMTEEEKEREAERLFVLFERLRATGVVDIANPVTQARNEGRFEEIE